MTDIVERLGSENWWLNVSGDEAAEEIKRLREVIQRERERHRDEIEQWKGHYEGMLAVAKTADVENKRLRALLQMYRAKVIERT